MKTRDFLKIDLDKYNYDIKKLEEDFPCKRCESLNIGFKNVSNFESAIFCYRCGKTCTSAKYKDDVIRNWIKENC